MQASFIYVALNENYQKLKNNKYYKKALIKTIINHFFNIPTSKLHSNLNM